jgi:serine/threonine protein kinase
MTRPKQKEAATPVNLPHVEGRKPVRAAAAFTGEPHHVFQPGDYCTDRYAVLELLAAGGMAEVYIVNDRERNEFAALKTLQLKHRKNKALVKRADSEAKTLLEIHHRNLVRVTDAGIADGHIIFFVMELLRGCTLRELLSAHGPLPLSLAIDLVIQLAVGVHALHTLGVIHRDLKPENAFVVRPGLGESTLLLKLLDLGAAKFEHRHHVTTSINFNVGTLQYLSPEQSAGESKIDVRTDVYALCIILFELATGIHPARLQASIPFTNGEWTTWHMHAAKPLLDAVLHDAPPALVQLLRAGLHNKHEKRIPDALTLASALAAIRQGLPGPANDVSSLRWRATPEAAEAADRVRIALTSDLSPRVPFASTSEVPEVIEPAPAQLEPAPVARDTVRMSGPPEGMELAIAVPPPPLLDSPAPPAAPAIEVSALALDEKPTVRLADAPEERAPWVKDYSYKAPRSAPLPARPMRSISHELGRRILTGLFLAIVLLGLGGILHALLEDSKPAAGNAPSAAAAASSALPPPRVEPAPTSPPALAPSLQPVSSPSRRADPAASVPGPRPSQAPAPPPPLPRSSPSPNLPAPEATPARPLPDRPF